LYRQIRTLYRAKALSPVGFPCHGKQYHKMAQRS
jgi:hypothetical protein